jgi:hypothetical protein
LDRNAAAEVYPAAFEIGSLQYWTRPGRISAAHGMGEKIILPESLQRLLYLSMFAFLARSAKGFQAAARQAR